MCGMWPCNETNKNWTAWIGIFFDKFFNILFLRIFSKKFKFCCKIFNIFSPKLICISIFKMLQKGGKLFCLAIFNFPFFILSSLGKTLGLGLSAETRMLKWPSTRTSKSYPLLPTLFGCLVFWVGAAQLYSAVLDCTSFVFDCTSFHSFVPHFNISPNVWFFVILKKTDHCASAPSGGFPTIIGHQTGDQASPKLAPPPQFR